MNLNNLKKHLKSPFVTIAIACFVFGIIFLLLPQNKKTQSVQKITRKTLISTKPTEVLSPTLVPSLIKKSDIQIIDPTVAIQPTLTKIQENLTAIPTNSPTPKTDTFKLEINEPDGNFSYIISYHDNTNPCSILNDAKNNGDIKSVTINHYGQPLNSDYVKEMNGYSENWNFSINGTSMPKGCSNYTLSKNDTVLWKFD